MKIAECRSKQRYCSRRFILVCALIGILSLSVGCSPSRDPVEVSSPSPVASSPAATESSPTLSPEATEAVLADLARRTQIPRDRLKIADATPETWANGCLGLAQPDEICTQALVEGWRIEVSDGNQSWVYRSDRTGQNLRLESD